MSALKDDDMTEDKVMRDIVKIDQQRHRRDFEFIGVFTSHATPWGPGGLSRECVLRIRILMRVVKGD